MKEAEINLGREQRRNSLIQTYTPVIVLVATIIIFYFTIKYSQKTYETQFRPYIGVTEIKMNKNSSTNINIEYTLRNTGVVPANSIKIYSYKIIDGQKKDIPANNDLPTYPIYLMPQPSGAKYILRMDEELDKIKSESRKWTIGIQISYDGVTTKSHQTVMETAYNFSENSFDITGGSAN